MFKTLLNVHFKQKIKNPSKDLKDSLWINTCNRYFKPILLPMPLVFAMWCSSYSTLLFCCIWLISGQGFNPLIANWGHISTQMLLWCAATLSMWEEPRSLTLGPGSGAALQGCTCATNMQVTHNSQHQAPPLRFPAEQIEVSTWKKEQGWSCCFTDLSISASACKIILCVIYIKWLRQLKSNFSTEQNGILKKIKG